MASGIIIRNATPDDAGAIMSIYAPYVTDTAITFEQEVPSEEEFRSRISDTLRMYPYLVAEEDGTVIGYTYAGRFRPRRSYDNSVELSVYVRNDRRRQGIGRMLYIRLEEILESMNVRLMVACISYSDEEVCGSRSFHERMGFVESGLIRRCGIKFGRWYDLLYMTRRIGPECIPDSIIPFPELDRSHM